MPKLELWASGAHTGNRREIVWDGEGNLAYRIVRLHAMQGRNGRGRMSHPKRWREETGLAGANAVPVLGENPALALFLLFFPSG